MTESDLEQQLDILIDKYEAIQNRARAQTHRNAIATSAMEVLMQRRSLREQSRATVPPPPSWPITRIGGAGWNGTCKSCKKPGTAGHRVAWDPESGRPSVWQHVDCSAPYGRGGRQDEPRLPLGGKR